MFGITVVIPTSPIPSHPSTEIIDQTIKSIRFHMPNVPIIVMADGLREEQEDRAGDYGCYIGTMRGRALPQLIKIVNFSEFSHQIGMMRKILPQIETELLLWCEHDTPLVTDCPIFWYDCCRAIEMGRVNLIRFLHEAHIHPEHQHMTRGVIDNDGVWLTATVQFSARPHLASVEFYKKLLQRFSPDAKCFIEDYAHSVCQYEPWEDWKLSIYSPFGNMKRSLHTDGRAGGAKFDDTQVF